MTNLNTELPPTPKHVPNELVVDMDPLEAMSVDRGDNPNRCIGFHAELPPVFWATRFTYLGPSWVVQNARDIKAILQDTDTFSSSGSMSFSALLGESWPLLPLEVDPPEHAIYRDVIASLFGPKKMIALEGRIREVAIELIDSFAEQGSCDFNKQFALRYPVLIFLELMGWPLAEAPKFVGWVNSLIKTTDMEQAAAAVAEIAHYLRERIALAREAAGDDFCSYVVNVDIEGRKMTDDEALGMSFLIFIAGLDTVASALSFHYMHLATHPEQQTQLREKPEMIPAAVEELLRAYSTVSGRRRITKDVVIGGVQMLAGDFVVVSTILANSDPAANECPEKIDFERKKNRHTAFSYGVHHCAGAHLARRELIIAMQEWLSRIPPFTAIDTDAVTIRPAGVMGLENVHLTW